jgi:site-specific DNA-methyltransferase (adenine-specific)
VTQDIKWQVHNQDCLEGLRELADGSVDFVFADPPYHLSNGGFTVSSGKQVPVDKGEWDKSQGFKADLEFHRSWLTLVHEKLADDGSIVISGTYHSIYKCAFILQELGFRILNEIVWFKPNGAPNLSGRMFAASHETLIWASKHQNSRHTFNYLDMKNSTFPEDRLKNPGKQMRSVWSIPSTPSREKLLGGHPTQKPEALLNRVLRACSNAGDLVLDPFCGSGTTGVAAVSLGRAFVGFEIDSTFASLAKNRISRIGERHD